MQLVVPRIDVWHDHSQLVNFEIHSSSSEQYVWVFIEFFSSIKNYFDIHWHEIIAILSLTNQQTVASRVRRTLVFIKSDAINRVVNDDLICMRIFFSRRSSRCDVNTSLLSDLDQPDMFDQRMHETKMSRCATVSESQHRDAFDTWIKSNELRRTRVRCDNSSREIRWSCVVVLPDHDIFMTECCTETVQRDAHVNKFVVSV